MKKDNEVMLKTIKEIPNIIENILKNKELYTKDFVQFFLSNNIKRIYFSGTGSPNNASHSLKYTATKLLKVEATDDLPNIFNSHMDFNPSSIFKNEEQVVICVSESGKTKGSIETAKKAKELGIPVICITTNKDGLMSRTSDLVIPKNTGTDPAIPSTKGHVASIFTLTLCFVDAAYAMGNMSKTEYETYLCDFAKLPHSINSAIDATCNWFNVHQKEVMNADYYRFIGYGLDYATAKESALKFTESHLRLSIAYEQEDFMHGPLHAVKPEDVLFFFATQDGDEKNRLFRLVEFVKSTFTKNAILIQSKNDFYTNDMSIVFDSVNKEFLTPMEYLIPPQVLSYLIASHLGHSVVDWEPVSVTQSMETCFED